MGRDVLITCRNAYVCPEALVGLSAQEQGSNMEVFDSADLSRVEVGMITCNIRARS